MFGHVPNFESNKPSTEVLIYENDLENEAQIAHIKKIHRPFGRASIYNMQKLS